MKSVCIFADSREKEFSINVETKCFPGIKMIAFHKKVEKFLDEHDQSNNKVICYFARINYLTTTQIAYNYEEFIAN